MLQGAHRRRPSLRTLPAISAKRARCRHTLAHLPPSLEERNASVNALVHIAHQPSSDDFSVAIKDNICTSSMPTTCASKILRNFTSPYDATVVRLLQDAGVRIVGKTNCDEFGMGSLNMYSVHGPVINPYQSPDSTVPWTERERRSAGGSSGGSAAAVAAGMCDAALGTDTGGSIRLPASYCGVVGFKPSYGLVSRYGVVSYADSLDTVGVLARTVQDVKRTYKMLAVYDALDPTTTRPVKRRMVSQECQKHQSHYQPDGMLSGLRIGVPQEYFPAELDRSALRPVRRILAQLKARGASIIPVSLPSTRYALSAYYVISSTEASSNMARYDGIQYGTCVEPPPDADKTKTANVYAYSRSAGFGREVQKRILLGTYALTADAFDNYFLQAQRVRKLIRADFDNVFCIPNVLRSSPSPAAPEGVHVLLHPSAIRTAPRLPAADVNAGTPDGEQDELGAYVQDVLTVPASLAGLPALSVPAGLADDRWPIGVSVIGQWGCDEMVLDVGAMCEKLQTV